MKYLLIVAFIVLAAGSFSQPISPQSIEDSVIGWMKVYHFKGTKEGKKVDNKLYSAAQLSLCDSFANWMQASYTPKGGLGDVNKIVSDKLGLYNQYTAAKPQSYGAYSKTYFELKYNSSRKIELFTSGNIVWIIRANGVPGEWALKDICTPGQYYFTIPKAETEIDNERVKKLIDLTQLKNIKPYISFWVKNMGFGRGTENVILSKDNKSPFVQLTKNEYLQALETAIPKYYEREKKIISEAEQGIQQRIAVAVKYLDKKIEDFVTGLKNNREKYKNRLDEPALTSAQPGLSDLANGRDVFSSQYLTDPESTSTRYPVYKVDPEMAELCKKDKPQWILISWDYYPGAMDRIEQQQHEAIVNNFNFDYVYNFFFAPEKVKGQAYKPLRSPIYKEAVATTEASETTRKNTADKNIHFFEDFSTTTIGKKPSGWRAESSNAESIIISPDGLNGKWMVIAGEFITLTSLKKPLPQNFTLSYELAASQNFKWGAYGLTLTLAKEISPGNAESYLKLKLRPGFAGKDGETTFETKFPFPPGYSNVTKWYAAPGFSNDKKINRVTVTIKKIDERLQVFIDKAKIVEYEKAIPAAHLFNALSLNGGTREGDKFYISNIKITKD